MDILQLLEHGAEDHLPNVSIDVVIIGYQKGDLKCLLLQLGDSWTLPGGYVKNDESVEVAAARILMERTNLRDQHLKFFAVFGDKNRKFGQEFKAVLHKHDLPWKEGYWVNQRFVSLAYYSLVDIEKVDPEPGEYHERAVWFSYDELPNTWLDHQLIVLAARDQLKLDIRSELTAHHLLPEEFTMPQLHQLHQAVLGEKLDRSRFQKNMLATGLFERLPKLQKESPGSNPFLYRLK